MKRSILIVSKVGRSFNCHHKLYHREFVYQQILMSARTINEPKAVRTAALTC